MQRKSLKLLFDFRPPLNEIQEYYFIVVRIIGIFLLLTLTIINYFFVSYAQNLYLRFKLFDDL